jgi:hypothetical protein
VNRVLTASNVGTRLTVTHAGAKNDLQLIYKAESMNGDYHHHVTRSNSEKWVREKLISNMPEKPVVIFDNVPYKQIHREGTHDVTSCTVCNL